MVRTQHLVEVEESAEDPVLVVMAVALRQVPLQVGGENAGVFRLPESGDGEAVSLTGVDEVAFQEEVGQNFAELSTPSRPMSHAAASLSRQPVNSPR